MGRCCRTSPALENSPLRGRAGSTRGCSAVSAATRTRLQGRPAAGVHTGERKVKAAPRTQPDMKPQRRERSRPELGERGWIVSTSQHVVSEDGVHWNGTCPVRPLQVLCSGNAKLRGNQVASMSGQSRSTGMRGWSASSDQVTSISQTSGETVNVTIMQACAPATV